MNRAGTLCAAAHALAIQIDHPHAIGLSLYARGVCHLLCGRWVEARTALEAAADVFRERCQSANWERATTHTMLLTAMAMHGDFRLLLSRVPEFLEVAREKADPDNKKASFLLLFLFLFLFYSYF